VLSPSNIGAIIQANLWSVKNLHASLLRYCLDEIHRALPDPNLSAGKTG
jgi:hypothetical protein